MTPEELYAELSRLVAHIENLGFRRFNKRQVMMQVAQNLDDAESSLKLAREVIAKAYGCKPA